jgi:hypothetical protein
MFPRLVYDVLLDVFDNMLFRLFSHAFFENIGLGPGSALLAGISFALIAVFFVSNTYHLIQFLLLTTPFL